ncbi:unnamed protein product [Ambrosiozyma monospora]|uniref:Unnamed protein product n=1 Tax=Ambrosiozyma monospora TaxID=43982 RepID=A0ACB5U4B2_AMBMO|nr:unnamed protein product [Ambrosiozyma monospora]
MNAVKLSLNRPQAKDFNLDAGTVLAIKSGKINEFNGSKSVSLMTSSMINKDPDLPEAYKLKGWFDNSGFKEDFKSLKGSSDGGADLNSKESILARKTIQQVNDERLGYNEKPDYFNMKATISFIKTDNFSYPACQSSDCNRKVIEQSDGTWRCEKCDKNYEKPKHRYILTISVVDTTGQLWLTLFDEHAHQLIGMTADELIEFKESDHDNKLKKFVNENISFNEFGFRIKGRLDSYQGVDRARFQVVGLSKIDYSVEADALCEVLDKVSVN